MEKAFLEDCLGKGMSLEQIGKLAGKHPSTVRYWLHKYGLSPNGAARHAPKGGLTRDELKPLIAEGLTIEGIARRLGIGDTTVRHWLKRHGLKTANAQRRVALGEMRRTGRRDIELKCREARPHALQFHHVDLSTKSFGLGVRGITRSIAKMREEASKCVLLCANCHAELEAGVIELPVKSEPSIADPM